MWWNYHTDNRPYPGIAVYHTSATCFENMNYFGMEIVVDNLKIVYIDIFLCFVYCPPKKAAFHSYKKVFVRQKWWFSEARYQNGRFYINLVESTSLIEYVKESYQLRRLINLLQIMELYKIKCTQILTMKIFRWLALKNRIIMTTSQYT